LLLFLVSSNIFLSSAVFTKYITSLNTPLSIFISVFIDHAFKKTQENCGVHGMALHDPSAISLAIDILSNNTPSYTSEFVDMKVEYQGIYTRGMTVIDKRPEGYSNSVKPVLEVHKMWNDVNNVEIINSYNCKSFIDNFFKTTFNVDYSEENIENGK
jgi:inosine-uridine nucleoside N-ribohydrolase